MSLLIMQKLRKVLTDHKDELGFCTHCGQQLDHLSQRY